MVKLSSPSVWLSSIMIWAKPKQIWQDQQHLWDQDEQALFDLDLNCSWWKFLCRLYMLSAVTINVVYVKAFSFTSRRFTTFPYYILMNTTVVIIDSLCCCTVLVFMNHETIHPCYYIQHMRLWYVTKISYNTVYHTCCSKTGGRLFMLHLSRLTCVWVNFSNWFAVWEAQALSLWR